MTGKAILILVMLSFVIFSRFEIINVSTVNRTFDRMVAYDGQSRAYNIAVAGANAAFARLNELNPPNAMISTSNITNNNFNGGSFTIDCSQVAGGVFKMVSTGTYTIGGTSYNASVALTYQPGNLARYAYFSENEGSSTIWWNVNDLIEGPFHTQSDVLHVRGEKATYGTPAKRAIFMGEASIKGSGTGVLDYYHSHNDQGQYDANYKTIDKPDFQMGFWPGVDYPMSTASMDSTLIAANSGNAWKITGKTDVYLRFDKTKVYYKYKISNTETSGVISTLAKNGVIYVQSGDVHIKGTISGKVTLLCTGTAGATDKGNIWLDGNITLSNSPRNNNTSSTDFLGLVASNNVWITDTDDAGTSCNNSSINIDAAIYCDQGGFGAYNHSKRGTDGAINLCGGIVQKSRQPVGLIDGTGFTKNYRYDTRFRTKWPPFYPSSASYRIMSWYDGVGTSSKY